MSVIKLSEQVLDSLTGDPGKAQTYFWDEGLSGFGVVVGTKRKTFVVRHRFGEILKKVTIGPTSAWSLEEAREKARQIINGDGAVCLEKTIKRLRVVAIMSDGSKLTLFDQPPPDEEISVAIADQEYALQISRIIYETPDGDLF